MNLMRLEGVLLERLPYQEEDLILTLFTEQEGLMTLFLKKGLKKKELAWKTSPLTRIECEVTTGRGMGKCQEIVVLDSYQELRKSLKVLQAAGEILFAIKSSQAVQKPSFSLYRLLTAYLKALVLAKDPGMLASSFYLKLLRHDGLLGIDPFCSHCKTPLEAFFLWNGECFCQRHAPVNSLHLDKEEALVFSFLGLSRSLKEISALPSLPTLSQKIKTFFLFTFDLH